MIEITLPVATNFFTAILLLTLGVLGIYRNHKSVVNVSFALLCLSAFIWLFSYSQAYRVKDEMQALLWFRMGYPGVVFIGVTYYHFSTSFLNIKKFKPIVFINYCVGIIFSLLLIFTDLIIDGVNTYYWGFYPKAGVFHPLFLCFFMLCLNAAVGQLIFWLFFRKNDISLHQNQQLKYLIAALGVFTLASIDFIPNYGIEVYPFGIIPATIFICIIFYSIVIHRILDISVALTRTTIFVAVYSMVLGIPFALSIFGQEYLFLILNVNWWIVPLLASTILATVGPFIYIFIQRKAENHIFQEQRRYQNTLRQAAIGMGRIKDLERLLNLIVHIVTRTVKIESCSIYIQNDKSVSYRLGASRARELRFSPESEIDGCSTIIKQLKKTEMPILYDEIVRDSYDFDGSSFAKIGLEMRKMRASLIIPSIVDERLLAIIILGKKNSNKLYTEDDLSVFSILSGQAGLAIENALFYEDMKKTHEQLFKAEKMATIGTMADGLSHQINNRLHALGFIAGDALDSIKVKKKINNLADYNDLIVDIEHALHRIQDNVEQGGDIVQGLLKYTRKGEEGYTAVDFDQLINSAVEMTQFKIKPGELKIDRDYSADIPKIKGNFTQLQEVMFNLIDNAFDAMKQKKDDLALNDYKPTINIKVVYNQGRMMEIYFKDNGMGIKKDDKDKLFTPFFSTKLSSKKGTGLGLYVIQKLIRDNHGGTVEYSSEFKKGTTVHIRLPIAHEEPEQEEVGNV